MSHSFFVPILRGPLRGFRWAHNSRGKILRVLGGSYEPEQTQLFIDAIRSHEVVFDVGANAGYYTCLASQLVSHSGRVVAFEPDPQNCDILRKHVARNSLRNVNVCESAVGNARGSVHFAKGTGSGTGRVDDTGEFEIDICRIDDYIDHTGLIPHHIKIDVEGGEFDVLLGAEQTLRKHAPTLYLSTHGPDIHTNCRNFLVELRYNLSPILGDDINTTTELLCLPPIAPQITDENHANDQTAFVEPLIPDGQP